MTIALDMIRGRSNIVTMTNNSGGALAAGDVCVQDTAGDEYVTTTTSAASTSKVFIAAETIASGASGKFYESGYCPLVNVNASVTRGRFLFTHTVAKQAAENATYGSGAFGRILKSGTTPSAIIYSATAQISGTGVTRSGSTTDNHLAVWNGSSADSIKDGGVIGPAGELGYAQITTSFTTNSASYVDVTGLTTTVTIGSRPVKITAFSNGLDSADAGAIISINIYDSTAGARLANCQVSMDSTKGGAAGIIIARHAPAAGSRTYKVQMLISGGGTGRLTAGADYPAFIMVEEV